MRRSLQSLIVALLCLTLFVDSAKACWWLRQHRSRSQVCRPSACRPATQAPCAAITGETVIHDDTMVCEMIVVDDQPDCLCAAAPVEHATVAEESVELAVVEQAGQVEDTVVVHSPTIVVDTARPPVAAGAAEPMSVVTTQKAEQLSPAAAQPMPIASAGLAVLQTPTATQEPIPDLKPAIAPTPTPTSAVEPASNEQPMPETRATPGASALVAAAAQPSAADEPRPAAVEDLAGGPDVKPAMPEPKEPNLFDLYGDEGDDEAAPSEEPAEESAESAADDAGEPAEDAAAETTPADEAEMTEDEAEATDGDSESAEEAAPAEEPAAEEADAAPKAAADPAEAAVTVPNEPMRRWTNDTGTHHTQGWLVEVRADRVRILKVNGRHTTVLTESLSAADRDYVSAVGDRLAAQQQGTSPAPMATAGL